MCRSLDTRQILRYPAAWKVSLPKLPESQVFIEVLVMYQSYLQQKANDNNSLSNHYTLWIKLIKILNDKLVVSWIFSQSNLSWTNETAVERRGMQTSPCWTTILYKHLQSVITHVPYYDRIIITQSRSLQRSNPSMRRNLIQIYWLVLYFSTLLHCSFGIAPDSDMLGNYTSYNQYLLVARWYWRVKFWIIGAFAGLQETIMTHHESNQPDYHDSHDTAIKTTINGKYSVIKYYGECWSWYNQSLTSCISRYIWHSCHKIWQFSLQIEF